MAKILHIDTDLQFPNRIHKSEAYMRVDLGTVNQNSANASDCLMDDIYMVHANSLIDPTGFTVGQKVFEPPVRGGFDGTIKQY